MPVGVVTGGHWDLDDEHEALRASVEHFAQREVAPVIGRHYAAHTFPYEIVAGMAAMGLFGLPFPQRYGGMGGDLLALCLAIEELARVDSSVAITLEAAVGLGAMPIARFGTEEQRQRWLPSLCRGERLGAFALTEPDGGSDAGSPRTRARHDAGTWVIDGTKAFITNSGTDITSLITVAARTAERDGRPEISTIVVPAGTPGLTVGPAYRKVGWCASDTHELAFDACRVPGANLLGAQGRGYAQFLEILDEGRIAIAALSVGLAQGCVDECLRHLGERRAFGKRIGEFQALQFKVADMQTRTHTARLAWRDAAARAMAGVACKQASALAKLAASEAAVANARDAAQIFGGSGFLTETPAGRFYRDAKILEVGEGTSEVQRMVIARGLGLPPVGAAAALPEVGDR